MSTFRTLRVTGGAEFSNPAETDEQPIRRAEYDAALEILAATNHAPITVSTSNSLELILPGGTQALSARVRRKITDLTTSEGAILETSGGLVVKLGFTADAAAPGTAIASLQSALDGKAAILHTHALADVSGLQAALDAKAALSHSHAIADVTSLQAALDAKAASDHTHAAADSSTAGFLSAADKVRLDTLVASNVWLPSVPTRADLPLNTDPINSMRLVQDEAAIFRCIANIGFVADQWERTAGSAKAAATIGDGTSTVIDFTHNLGTLDIKAEIRYSAPPRARVDADWAPFDINTIRMTFGVAPTSGSLRVIVFG